MDKRKGNIWNFFSAEPDHKAKCLQPGCGQKLKPGTNPSNYSTTPLINHLRTKHREQYAEFEQMQSAAESATSMPPPRPTLTPSPIRNQPNIISSIR